MADRQTRLRHVAHRVAAGVLGASLLLLAACRVDVPDEHEPADRGAGQCPMLEGIWDLSAAPGLAGAFPGGALPQWLENSVTAVRIGATDDRHLVVELLADADAVVAAAEALRASDPSRYATWRRRVEAGASDEAILAEGPALSMRRTLGEGSCTDGWLSLGYERHAPDANGRHFTGIALSRNSDGALLVRRHYSRTKYTGFVFFGQNVSYERDAGSQITLLAPRTDARELAARQLQGLALGVDPAALADWRAQAPDRLVRINSRLLASLPPGVIPAQFEVVNLDVTDATAVPDHFRIAMAVTFPSTWRNDPLLEALQAQSGVSGLELVSQGDAGNGRRRTAVQFDYRD